MSYYFQPEWRKVRLEVLQRDQSICRECGKAVSGRDAHVHHNLPRALGGRDVPENLVTLCSGCHSIKHANLHVRLGTRFLQSLAVRIAKLFGGNDLKNVHAKNLGLALRYLGIARLRSNQLDPIMAALNGENVLLISPTGSGKSLCFQLPALIAPSHSIVISPLKALMTDQVIGLLKRNYPATFLNSDISREEMKSRLSLIAKGVVRLVYLAPERFAPSRNRQEEQAILKSNRPSYFVVDEAHCIDKWGDAFRPAYSDLGKVRKQLGSPPVLAFTATANKVTRKGILQSLGIENARVFVEDLDRPNIALSRLRVHNDHTRVNVIAELHGKMRAVSSGKTLVFVPTVKVGQEVETRLASVGIVARFFHGGLSVMRREQYLTDLRDQKPTEDCSDSTIMICTNAFGMGMDIPDVRLVFHWHHPSSVEDYAQEYGRVGRDGKQSLAVLFTKDDDSRLLEFMAKKSVETTTMKKLDQEKALTRRTQSIQLMNSISKDRAACFNQLILDELGVSETKLPRLSRWILGLAFASRSKSEKRAFCCDRCWARKNQGPATNFSRAVVSAMR